MFNKRSLLTLASLAAALVAHAGSIQILASNSFQGAEADGFSGSFGSNNFAPGYTAVSVTTPVSSAVSDNAVYFDGTTLSGYSQTYGASDVSTGSAGDFSGYSQHYVIFSLTATSAVSYGIAADAGSTATKRGKGTSSSASAAGYAALLHLGNSGWETVSQVEDTDAFLGAGTWGQGTYAFITAATVSGYADAGTKKNSSAYADAYSYGVYSLTAQAVPEPTSIAALAFGAAALLRRRKKA